MQTYYVIKPIWTGEESINRCFLYVENTSNRLSKVWLKMPLDEEEEEEEDYITWATDTLRLWLQSGHIINRDGDPIKICAYMGDITIDSDHGTYCTVYNSKELGVMCSDLYIDELRAKKQVYLFPRSSAWVLHGPEPILYEIKKQIEWNNYYPDEDIEQFIANWETHPIRLVKVH